MNLAHDATCKNPFFMQLAMVHGKQGSKAEIVCVDSYVSCDPNSPLLY
jgi:hypothetical protein